MRVRSDIKSFNKAIVLALLFYINFSFSQTISAPTYVFTQMCASPTFNTYSVNFNFSGTFGAGNQFVLEMSNASGSFSSPTILATSSTITSSPGSFNYSIPTTTAGQNYKLRVRATNPAIIGSNSGVIPAYYQAFNNSFYINNQVSTVNICSGGNYTLSIDDATPTDPSPKSFPSLRYKWFKDNGLITGLTGTETAIQINSAGVYRCEIDYGSCSTVTSITKSQNVTVNIVTGGSTFTITSSTGNSTCPSIPTTLSTTPGYNYQWFKDNVAISGATNYTYTTTSPGAYYVQVNQGGCSSTSNTITLSATGFNASINVLEAPAINTLLEGETKNIAVTTNALSPTYQWYLEGNPITGETNPTLDATAEGNYKVVINQTTGCTLSKEISFILKFGVPVTEIPNTISPNNADKINDTWDIPQEYKNIEHEILIMDSYGKIVLQTANYQGNWPTGPIDFKSVNPVYLYIISKGGSPIKKGSITIIK